MRLEEEWTTSTGKRALEDLESFFGDVKRKFRRPTAWPSQAKQKAPVVYKVGAPSFLERLYALCDAGRSEAALDLILDEIDPLIDAGRISRCSDLLEEVDLRRLSVPAALGFLSATTLVRHQLVAYPRFVEAVHARIAAERTDAERLIASFR